jgi:hypothetical protein
MQRIIILGLILVLISACATPQVIKETSRQQVEIIRGFQKALGDLRTKLLVFYDEEIEEFRQDVLKNRMAVEQSRVVWRVDEAIRAIDPALPKEQRVSKVKEVLDAAANYLTELPDFYFDKNYCRNWPDLKKVFLREPSEKCRDDHVQQYQKLLAGREEVAKRFDRLVKAVGKTAEAHYLVNEFLQIEFRLTKEQVDEAKKVIEEASKTIKDAKTVWTELRSKEEGGQ